MFMAPSSGTVTRIGDHVIPHPSGLADLCIEIETDGEERWCELRPEEHYESLTVEQIQEKVRHAGIAGMGGAGFPTEIKMHPPQQDKVNTLIINAAECEPLYYFR